MDFAALLPLVILVALVFVFLAIDLKFFARGREPEFRAVSYTHLTLPTIYSV